MSAPLCRYCGKPIAKYTTWVHFTLERAPYQNDTTYSRWVVVPDYPQTMAECQAFTNKQVVAVKRASSGIHQFSEWDSKSYMRKFFCKNRCAEAFGNLMAKAGHSTARYNEALEKQRGADVA